MQEQRIEIAKLFIKNSMKEEEEEKKEKNAIPKKTILRKINQDNLVLLKKNRPVESSRGQAQKYIV